MNYLIEKNYVKHVLVWSSGNFGGIDWEIIKSHIRKFNFFKNYFTVLFLRLFKGFYVFSLYS